MGDDTTSDEAARRLRQTFGRYRLDHVMERLSKVARLVRAGHAFRVLDITFEAHNPGVLWPLAWAAEFAARWCQLPQYNCPIQMPRGRDLSDPRHVRGLIESAFAPVLKYGQGDESRVERFAHHPIQFLIGPMIARQFAFQYNQPITRQGQAIGFLRRAPAQRDARLGGHIAATIDALVEKAVGCRSFTAIQI